MSEWFASSSVSHFIFVVVSFIVWLFAQAVVASPKARCWQILWVASCISFSSQSSLLLFFGTPHRSAVVLAALSLSFFAHVLTEFQSRCLWHAGFRCVYAQAPRCRKSERVVDTKTGLRVMGIDSGTSDVSSCSSSLISSLCLSLSISISSAFPVCRRQTSLLEYCLTKETT